MALRVGTISQDELRDGEHGYRGELRLAGHAIYSGPVTLRPQFKATPKSPDYEIVNRNGDAIAAGKVHTSADGRKSIQIWLHAPGFPEIQLAAFPPDENSSAAEREAGEWRVMYIPRREPAAAS